MGSGEPDGPVGRRVGRGLMIYAFALFAVGLTTAILAPYPFTLVAWGIAAVSAMFIAVFIVIPAMRRR